MNAISVLNYTLPANIVTSTYESEAETLRKLKCLYWGEDLTAKSMRNAVIIDGRGDAELDAELEQLFLDVSSQESKSLVVSAQMSDADLYQRLNELRARYANYAEYADMLETEIYSDIHSYELPTMNIRVETVIDFIDLQFSVSKATTRSNIKKYLTEKMGKAYFITDTHGIEHPNGHDFIVRVHDVKTYSDLKPVIHHLKHFGIKKDELKVNRIEVSTDFYGVKNKAFLIALFKSLAYTENACNERLYKNETERLPNQPYPLLTMLDESYCIGVNPKGAPIYYRLYYKITDNKEPLPSHEHRCRAEVNCDVEALGVDNHLINLAEIMQCAFEQLKLTKLNSNATIEDKEHYRQSVSMFGARNVASYSKSRHKRTFKPYISKNGEINTLISKQVSNLKRNFKGKIAKILHS